MAINFFCTGIVSKLVSSLRDTLNCGLIQFACIQECKIYGIDLWGVASELHEHMVATFTNSPQKWRHPLQHWASQTGQPQKIKETENCVQDFPCLAK